MMKKRRSAIRDKLKGKLRDRVKESYERRETTRRGVFITDLPEEVKFWSVKEGEHLIDIIPYIAGPNDPLTREGEPTYILELKVHPRVGPGNGQDFLCLAENYGKPCPVCEHRKQLQSEGADDEEWKALIPKRRCVYNIVCYDSAEEEDKGVQIWEVAWWFSERYFVELAKGPTVGRHRRGSKSELGFIPFADPDEGKSIAFIRKGSGAQNTQYLGHRFVDRDYTIPDDILEAAWTLDELIYVPTYEEVYNAYWGTEEGGSVADEEDVSDEPSEQEEIEEQSTTVRRHTDDEGQTEVEDASCPGGGVFGEDTDQLDYCEECDVWEDCVEEYERRESEKRKKKSSRRRRK